ncbi:MAG: hypothetical protein NC191_03915 [Muribaculaceae bacterium]|nr:hypothetical protein [Muribaculaceae bacterium]
MANLDKLLKQIEKNKETENEVKTHQLTIAGETFDVKTMTRKDKRDFVYTQEITKKKTTVGDIVNKMKPFIYKSIPELKELAVKAKDAGQIASYYDVIEAYFEPEQIIEIIGFITDINGLSENDTAEEIEEIKKP